MAGTAAVICLRTKSLQSGKPLKATTGMSKSPRYARQVVEKTRAELAIGVKKKPRRKPKLRRPQSSPLKKPKSKS